MPEPQFDPLIHLALEKPGHVTLLPDYQWAQLSTFIQLDCHKAICKLNYQRLGSTIRKVIYFKAKLWLNHTINYHPRQSNCHRDQLQVTSTQHLKICDKMPTPPERFLEVLPPANSLTLSHFKFSPQKGWVLFMYFGNLSIRNSVWSVVSRWRWCERLFWGTDQVEGPVEAAG